MGPFDETDGPIVDSHGIDGDPDGQHIGWRLTELRVVLMAGYTGTDSSRLVERFDSTQHWFAVDELRYQRGHVRAVRQRAEEVVVPFEPPEIPYGAVVDFQGAEVDWF